MGDGDHSVDAVVKKYKKRMWRVCGCGTLWMIIGLLSICIGIAFLAKFTEYWDEEDTWKRHLPKAGVGLLIAGLILIIIGIVFIIALYVLYKRLSHGPTSTFKPPNYKYGEAPYPQQPPWPPEGAQQPPPASGPAASAVPSAPVDNSEVHVEVSPHTKF